MEISVAAKAKGMTEIAGQAEVIGASLYKSHAESGNPGFDTISRVTTSLGCKLAVV